MGKRWAQAAFTGEGARIAGGRWNSKGTSIVYLASSLALAALELLAHVDHQRALAEHVAIPVDFDESLVEKLHDESLPIDFPEVGTLWATQQIGDAWARGQSSVMLRVPSAVVPVEFNYLYSPGHPQAEGVVIGSPIPFRFDRRLLDDESRQS
ncbi:MAG: RES domain-containing protein [Trueperaceae bacterium]